MDQLFEFIGNHLLLSAGFVAVTVVLLYTEFARRAQGFRMLTPAQAVAWMNQGDAQVVDVSPAIDFNKGHIQGAVNIALSRIQQGDKEVNRLMEKPVLVTCKTGQTAGQAAAAMVKRGAKEVATLKGGMSAWTAEHYPVTRR